MIKNFCIKERFGINSAICDRGISGGHFNIVNTSCNTSEGGSLCDIRHTRIVRIIIYKRRKTEVFEIFVSLFKSDCLGQRAYGANIHGVFDSIAYAGASDVFVIPVVYRLSAGVPVRLVFDRCCKSHAALV